VGVNFPANSGTQKLGFRIRKEDKVTNDEYVKNV
jgi:hypothetical protein